MIQRKPSVFVKDAIYLSHTSLNDFLKCPQAYYLKNIYRSPKTGYKLQIASPYISLGATIHDTIAWFLKNSGQLSLETLESRFRNFWLKFHGKRGGFASREEEAMFGKRGLVMISNFLKNASKLESIVPLPNFPKYPLTEKIILIGNLDFAAKLPDGSLHLIDFKTGTRDEDSPLQLYIYAILAENYYGKPVSKVSFWYLDRDDDPKDVVLDPLEKTITWLTEKGLNLQKAITENNWICQKEDLCRDCRDYQAIIDGKGEFMFSDHAFKKDIYFLER